MLRQESKYYFTYGSNMSSEKMHSRCKNPVFIGPAKLENYKFIINSQGASTIIPDKHSEVYGILWKLTDVDESKLDSYEGVHHGIYNKIFVDVKANTTKSAHAFTYVHSNAIPGFAWGEYVEEIVLIASQYKLPAKYISELRHWSENTKKQEGSIFESVINDTTKSYSSFIELIELYNGYILNSKHIGRSDTSTGNLRIVFSFETDDEQLIDNIKSHFFDKGFSINAYTSPKTSEVF